MRSQATFDAWLNYAKETVRMSMAVRTAQEYAAVNARTAEGQRLWEACLREGWTSEEAEQILDQAIGE